MQRIAALFHELAQKLGLPRFHFVGHDIGCWIGYTYASQYADTLRGATLMEAVVPGISPGGAYAFTAEQAKKTWHFFFNCLPELPEELTAGRESVYLKWLSSTRCATRSWRRIGSRTSGDRATRDPTRFRTIQVCPKDQPISL
jgi:pimeloyl-ACP methyl ester carboxylesterase